MGNYGIIMSLLGTLEQGLKAKKLVDRVIDSCKLYERRNHSKITDVASLGDQVTNLREDIFLHRINYSLTTMDEESQEQYLDRAVKALEK